MNRVTPYTMTGAAMELNPGLAMPMRSEPEIGEPGNYESREAIELTSTQAADTCENIAEVAWSAYQNLDEDRMVPDGGRSMMTGDLVLVEVDGKQPVWLVTMGCGFKDVTDQVAGRDMAAAA